MAQNPDFEPLKNGTRVDKTFSFEYSWSLRHKSKEEEKTPSPPPPKVYGLQFTASPGQQAGGGESIDGLLSEEVYFRSMCGVCEAFYVAELDSVPCPIPRRQMLDKIRFRGFDVQKHETMVSFTDSRAHDHAVSNAKETGFAGSVHASGWGAALSVEASYDKNTASSLNSAHESTSMVSTHSVEVTAFCSVPVAALDEQFHLARQNTFVLPSEDEVFGDEAFASSHPAFKAEVDQRKEIRRVRYLLDNLKKKADEEVKKKADEKLKIKEELKKKADKEQADEELEKKADEELKKKANEELKIAKADLFNMGFSKMFIQDVFELDNDPKPEKVPLFLMQYGTAFASRHFGGRELNRITAFSSKKRTHHQLSTATAMKASADASGSFLGVEAGVSLKAETKEAETKGDGEEKNKISVSSTLTAEGFIPNILGSHQEWADNLAMCTFVRIDFSTLIPLEALVAYVFKCYRAAKAIAEWKQKVVTVRCLNARTCTLRAFANGKFVSAALEANWDPQVVADRGEARSWERFRFMVHKDDRVSLRSTRNDLFQQVTVRDKGVVRCDEQGPVKDTEKFRIELVDDCINCVRIKAHNNQYLRVEDKAPFKVHADGSAPTDDRALFELVLVS